MNTANTMIDLNTIISVPFNVAFSKLQDSEAIPMQTRFKVKTMARFISQHIKDFEESRMKIVNKYAKKDEQGVVLKRTEDGKELVDIENIYAFNAEMHELLSVKCELCTLTSDEIMLSNLSAKDLLVLDALIVDNAT